MKKYVFYLMLKPPFVLKIFNLAFWLYRKIAE